MCRGNLSYNQVVYVNRENEEENPTDFGTLSDHTYMAYYKETLTELIEVFGEYSKSSPGNSNYFGFYTSKMEKMQKFC